MHALSTAKCAQIYLPPYLSLEVTRHTFITLCITPFQHRECDATGTSYWWRSLARNKLSVCIDLRKEDGRCVARRKASIPWRYQLKLHHYLCSATPRTSTQPTALGLQLHRIAALPWLTTFDDTNALILSRCLQNRKLVNEILPHCDVLVENFRPGRMEEWG